MKDVYFNGFNEFGGTTSLDGAIKKLIELQREGYKKLSIVPDGFDGEIAISVEK